MAFNKKYKDNLSDEQKNKNKDRLKEYVNKNRDRINEYKRTWYLNKKKYGNI